MPDNTTERVPVGTPICCHLRSKGMFMMGTTELDENAEEDLHGIGDGYFVCLKSMHAFGPDDQDVNRDMCRPSRSCFETV